MGLEEDLAGELREALRSGDGLRRDTVRLLRAALHNEAISLGRPLEPAEATTVVRRLINQHRDSIDQFAKGNRPDLVAKEQGELDILLGYLPEELSRDQIAEAASEAIRVLGAQGRKDMGRVMRQLAEHFQGRADMRLVSEVVQDLLP